MKTTKGLKLIGKGSFTKCYLLNNTTVLLKSVDPIKEAMAYNWFPDSELFPEVLFSSLDGYYEMKYYPKVTSLKNNLDSDQWLIYKQLRALEIPFDRNDYNRYDNLYKLFGTLENNELREIMQDALGACSNYGTKIGFEISPRNVACKNGKLILLDCFFMVDKLKEVRGNK